MDEMQRIRQAAKGDKHAFAELISEHLPAVYRGIMSVEGDPDLAFDHTREVFLRAWHGISLFPCDESFSQWLTELSSDVTDHAVKLNGQDMDSHEPPSRLKEAILTRIEREDGPAAWRESFRRFRFTLIALLLAGILLLMSRFGGCGEGNKPSKQPQSTPSVSQVHQVDAALKPGN